MKSSVSIRPSGEPSTVAASFVSNSCIWIPERVMQSPGTIWLLCVQVSIAQAPICLDQLHTAGCVQFNFSSIHFLVPNKSNKCCEAICCSFLFQPGLFNCRRALAVLASSLPTFLAFQLRTPNLLRRPGGQARSVASRGPHAKRSRASCPTNATGLAT